MPFRDNEAPTSFIGEEEEEEKKMMMVTLFLIDYQDINIDIVPSEKDIANTAIMFMKKKKITSTV